MNLSDDCHGANQFQPVSKPLPRVMGSSRQVQEAVARQDGRNRKQCDRHHHARSHAHRNEKTGWDKPVRQRVDHDERRERTQARSRIPTPCRRSMLLRGRADALPTIAAMAHGDDANRVRQLEGGRPAGAAIHDESGQHQHHGRPDVRHHQNCARDRHQGMNHPAAIATARSVERIDACREALQFGNSPA